LYEKNNYFRDKITPTNLKAAISIFDYMFYLNHSTITNLIKMDIANVYQFLLSENNINIDYYMNDRQKKNIESEINKFINGDSLIPGAYNGVIGKNC